MAGLPGWIVVVQFGARAGWQRPSIQEGQGDEPHEGVLLHAGMAGRWARCNSPASGRCQQTVLRNTHPLPPRRSRGCAARAGPISRIPCDSGGGADSPGAVQQSWLRTAVVVLTVLAFCPLLFQEFEFVNLDDAKGIYENPDYRGLALPQLEWMFTTFHMGHYQPLSWMSLGLDYLLWGMNPRGYHLTNLLLHVGSALLAFALFSRLLHRASPDDRGAIPVAAAVGALVFAVHPLRVESVAWVTERRDVLSGCLYLLALLFYVRRAERPESNTSYNLCLLFFVLSMFAKAWGVTFVIVLLLIDAWPLRRFATRGDWPKILNEKVPFLLISVVFMFLASRAQSAAGAMKSLSDYGTLQRLAQAAYGLCFYPLKTVWPVDLSPLYELEADLDPFSSLHVLCFGIVVAVSVALIVWRRRVPWLTISWFTYAVIVLPVLGFTQSGPQKVADRYTYLPCLPFALLAAGGVLVLLRRSHAPRSATDASATVATVATVAPVVLIKALLIPALLLVGLTVLTAGQVRIWRNSVELWEHAVRLDGQSHFALFNLAKANEDRRRYDVAIRYLRRALAVRPAAVDPRRNLGILLANKKQQFDAAIAEFEVLARQQPKNPEPHYCIGLSRSRQQRHQLAVRSFLTAVRLQPDYRAAHQALGESYARLGNRAKSAEHYRIAQRR